MEDGGYDRRGGDPGGSHTPYRQSARQPILNAPAVVTWLLAALAGVHLLRILLPYELSEGMIDAFAFFPDRLHAALSGGGYPFWPATYPLLSHGLLHADFLHLSVNGLWCLAFGAFLARRMSGPGFYIFFGICVLAGALLHYVSDPTSPHPLVGASGGISGLMGGAARLMFTRSIVLRADGQALPAVASLANPQVLGFTLVWTAINLVFGLAGGFGLAGENVRIAWEAHLGGYFAGLFLIPLFLVPIRVRL